MTEDIRYGLRMLARSPGFTAVALTSLGLGIAIGTSAYSEINGLVLRDLPGVPHPDELVTLHAPTSYPNYKRYRELKDVFSSSFAYVAPVPFGVSLGGRTERVWGHLVTGSYFSTLGMRPLLGRYVDQTDDQPGRPPVVVVSHRFWENHLGGDPSILGKIIRVNGHPATVIGIGPRDFLGVSPNLYAADLWLPISAGSGIAPELADNALERRDVTMFHVTGRLMPGVSMARAEAALDAAARALEQDFGEPDRKAASRRVALMMGGKVLPIRKQDLPFFTEFFTIVAGLVMLIACSNVANMMLARAAQRRREIAVRLALGASRARIVRQLLTESMLIAAGAGVLGFFVSVWLMRLGSQMKMPYPMGITYDLSPDWRALLFTLALAVFTGFAFGLAPALAATRTDFTPALKEGGNVHLRRGRRWSLRNLLMLSQVAGSMALLLLTGSMAIGIQSSLGIQEGFDPKNLHLISVDPVRDGYSGARAAVFFDKLLDRVQRLPSITAACLTDTLPVAMNGNAWVKFSTPAATGVDTPSIHRGRRYIVGKDYFQTTGIPILHGRAFRREDERDQVTAVIVSEALAGELWKGENPVGRRIEISSGEVLAGLGVAPGTFDHRQGMLRAEPRPFEVVGVAGDVAEGFTMQKPRPAMYFPLRPADYARPSLRGMTLIVRAAAGVDVITAMRREISAIDSGITPYNARSMTEQISQFMSPLRAAGWTYGVVGVFGLILASVGLAGVTAYSVARRRREIGIRMALGASRRAVLRLVMKEGAAVVMIGAIAGLAAAWAGMRVLSGISEAVARSAGDGSYDAVLLIGAPILLAALALAACYLPARESTRIDPAVALREE